MHPTHRPRALRSHALLPRSTRVAGLALLAGAAMLTACGPDKPTSADGYLPTPGSASAAKAAATASDTTAKFNGYVRVHDTLAGGAGLGSARRSYERAVLDARYKNASVSFSAGWIDHAIDELKKARALPGGEFPALDAAADKLLLVLEPLQRTLLEVGVYYSSKKYLDDNFATAKTRYASTLVAFNVADDANDAFDAELEKVNATLSARRLETLKASGDMLAYDLALSMDQAKLLLRSVRESAAASAKAQKEAKGKGPNPPPMDFSRSDPLMLALETTLADARVEHEKKKANADPNMTGSKYSEQAYVLDRLTDLVGMYRSFKKTRSQHDGDGIFSAYNSAVDFYNRIPRRQYQILPSK